MPLELLISNFVSGEDRGWGSRLSIWLLGVCWEELFIGNLSVNLWVWKQCVWETQDAIIVTYWLSEWEDAINQEVRYKIFRRIDEESGSLYGEERENAVVLLGSEIV